jgi:hypothetical protein
LEALRHWRISAAQKAETIDEAPLFVGPRERLFELRAQPSRWRRFFLGLVGVLCFFAIWEVGHFATPEAGQKFLPSVERVFATLVYLFVEKDFLHDVAKSCMRIFVSFFAASAIPLSRAGVIFPRPLSFPCCSFGWGLLTSPKWLCCLSA